MDEKPVEYRVREVTRYIVTEYSPNTEGGPTLTVLGTYEGGGTAQIVAEAMAASVVADGRPAIAPPFGEPLPTRERPLAVQHGSSEHLEP